MIRRFKLDSGFDISITLEIDTKVVTEELANNVATFWSNKDEVEEVSADVWEATARLAANELIPLLVEGYTPKGAAKELHEREGWCWPGELGIHIIDWELPDLSAQGLECEELVRGDDEDE